MFENFKMKENSNQDIGELVGRIEAEMNKEESIEDTKKFFQEAYETRRYLESLRVIPYPLCEERMTI